MRIITKDEPAAILGDIQRRKIRICSECNFGFFTNENFN